MKTYGTATYANGSWTVKAQPFVIIRLKRVMEKLDKSTPGEATFSDTPENAKDLLWFCERYPLVVNKPKHLRGQARALDAQLALT